MTADGATASPLPWSLDLAVPLLESFLKGTAERLFVYQSRGVAYEHPNGFKKIPLGIHRPTRSRLFLHIWDDHYADSDIHNHRWNFSSLVLSGQLLNTVYSIEPAPVPIEPERQSAARALLEECVYEPSGDGTRYRLAPVGRLVCVRQQSKRVVDAGQRYEQRAPEFHRATSTRNTVTLMSRGSHLQASATMLLRQDDFRIHGETRDGEELSPERVLRELGPAAVADEVERALSLCHRRMIRQPEDRSQKR